MPTVQLFLPWTECITMPHWHTTPSVQFPQLLKVASDTEWMAEVLLESVKSLPSLEMEFSSGTPARPIGICESTSNLHAFSVSAITFAMRLKFLMRLMIHGSLCSVIDEVLSKINLLFLSTKGCCHPSASQNGSQLRHCSLIWFSLPRHFNSVPAVCWLKSSNKLKGA